MRRILPACIASRAIECSTTASAENYSVVASVIRTRSVGKRGGERSSHLRAPVPRPVPSCGTRSNWNSTSVPATREPRGCRRRAT